MINIDNIVAIHDNPKTIHRHKRILEELFYLCINESFLNTVTDARQAIQEMLQGVDIELPISNTQTAVELKRDHLINNNDYLPLLTSVSERHNYYHPSFTRDYTKVSGEADINNRLNILENILFFNDPMPSVRQNPIEHFNNRSGYMEIAVDESGPHIRMQFDIGTTKREMQDIIDKLFPDTAELQKVEYGIPNKQYRQESSLKTKAIIHQQSTSNDDTQISIILGNEGLYMGDQAGDTVRVQRDRMQSKTERFTAND